MYYKTYATIRTKNIIVIRLCVDVVLDFIFFFSWVFGLCVLLLKVLVISFWCGVFSVLSNLTFFGEIDRLSCVSTTFIWNDSLVLSWLVLMFSISEVCFACDVSACKSTVLSLILTSYFLVLKRNETVILIYSPVVRHILTTIMTNKRVT